MSMASNFRVIAPIEENSNMVGDQDPFDESQQTQTQLTQPDHLTPDESSLLCSASSQQAPLSPPPILPWGRLVPCVPSAKLAAMDFMPKQSEYWIGRSPKCDVTTHIASSGSNLYSEKEVCLLEWGKSMISNKHCKIFQESPNGPVYLEDNSGNGTFVNQQTHLRRGQTRMLHSGDEICLVNADTLRKRITSTRVRELVLQQFSFIYVQSKPRKPCVNPRAMNYAMRTAMAGHSHNGGSNANNEVAISPRSSRKVEAFYDLREVLGDGTSGQVRRAIHRQTGKEFAVKIISLRRNLDMTAMEREVQLLQKLDHPYITSLVDVFVEPRMFMYIVMELVKGGDLFDRIVEKEKYTEVEARRTMRRLLSAVYYLHEHRNIVHRDLKPENVLCSSATHVKLADFGLAKSVKADGLKTFCGTPAYFAPEVLQRRSTVAGQGRYGKPADIWSLGVILYILLTGRPPFDTDTDESQGQYELDFETDKALWSAMPLAQELVQNMLRQDPKRRSTVRQCCDHPWINIEDGDTHRHPLDDPAVTIKKVLFEQVEQRDQQPQNQQSTDLQMPYDDDSSSCSSSHAPKDDVSVRSKDESVLSKEEFSNAAVSHHSRNDSFFHLDVASLEASETVVDPLNSAGTNGMDVESPPSERSNMSRPLSPSPRDVKSMSIGSSGDIALADEKTNDSTDLSNDCVGVCDIPVPTDHDVPTESDGSDTDPGKTEEAETPRSPLSKLSLNDRCNRFRDQVLQTKSDKDGNDIYQTAVTPTSSNTRKKEKQDADVDDDEDEAEMDPILSQFSSEPSSIESFEDSSDSFLSSKGPIRMERTLSTETPVCFEDEESKKRQIDTTDATTPNEGEPKRARVSLSTSKKQTTLSSWLVKAKNDN